MDRPEPSNPSTKPDHPDWTHGDNCLTPQQREQAKKDAWAKIVHDTSTVPVQLTEGYYQVLERMHHSWSPDKLEDEAHRIKKINHGRDVLYVGERLPLATEHDRRAMLDKEMKALEQKACTTNPIDPKDALKAPHNPNDRYNRYGEPPAAPSKLPQQDQSTLPGHAEQAPAKPVLPHFAPLAPFVLQPLAPIAPPAVIAPPVPQPLALIEPPATIAPLVPPPLAPLAPAPLKPAVPNAGPSIWQPRPGSPIYPNPFAPPASLDGQPPITAPGPARPGLPTPGMPGPGDSPGTVPLPNPLLDAAARLQLAHNQAESDNKQEQARQGFIGRTFDAAKNYLGAAENGGVVSSLWSHVLDADRGSTAVSEQMQFEQARLSQLRDAASRNDRTTFDRIYKEVTGQDYDPARPQAELNGTRSAEAYRESQVAGVDTITDVGAALASAATMRLGGGVVRTFMQTAGRGALAGAGTKALLMGMDGAYDNLPRDLAVGALWGGTLPVGELAGASLSRYVGTKYGMAVTGDLLGAQIDTTGANIGTRLLSAAVKSGTSGAVFGAVESPGDDIIQKLQDGRQITGSDLLERSLTGATTGFVGGTILGFAMDAAAKGFRSPRPDGPPSPGSPDISPIPGTGSLTAEEAAAALGMDTKTFLAKATADPHGAVQDAIAIYQKTGRNLQKFDPLTSQPVLPEKFQQALTITQNVDLLTADSQVPLTQKAGVVAQTDAYLETNPQGVAGVLDRLRADANYQQVVRLKTELDGAAAANSFEQSFAQSFDKDLKTGMSVDRIHDPALGLNDAFATNAAKTENAYVLKAADFYKDITDPAEKLRLNELTEDIFNKYNAQYISKDELTHILRHVPDEDRALAIAILQESAPNASEAVLKTRLQSLKGQLMTSGHVDDVYTLSPSSSGNFLGYLFRKSNSMSMGIRNFDKLAAEVAAGNTPKSIVLFDDLSTTRLTEAQRSVLAKIPSVKVVDLGAFEKGINVLDAAHGPGLVATKLNSLLVQARAIARQRPELLPTAVARQLLTGSVDDVVSSLRSADGHSLAMQGLKGQLAADQKVAGSIPSNIFMVRPEPNLHIPNLPAADVLAGMDPVDALNLQLNVPKASREEIAAFLSNYVGEEREMAARILAIGATSNTYESMLQNAVNLHGQIQGQLEQLGMTDKSLLLVSDKDPGGSTHMISYLYGLANGLKPENFISARGVQRLIAQGNANKYALAYLDDAIYSGSQTSGMLTSNALELAKFNKVFIGGLGAYQQGLDLIGTTQLVKSGKASALSPTIYHPFYSQTHPFFKELSPAARATVKHIGGTAGFGGVQGSVISSHMYADNLIEFLGPRFGGGVLRLPGP